MSQATWVIPANQSGLSFRTLVNAALAAIGTSHKGATAPSYADDGTFWLDDAADPSWILKVYDGADWITVLTIDTTNNVISFSNTMNQDSSNVFATTTGSANAYVYAPTPAFVAYTTGMVIRFKANFANTGACTINVNGLGAKNLKKWNTVDLAANDIRNGQCVEAEYDGTQFQVLSPLGNDENPYQSAAVGGTGDAITATFAPAFTAYFEGMMITFKAGAANTGATTINVNGLGVKTIKKLAGGPTTDLAANDIRTGQLVTIRYDGTNFQMMSPLGN